MAALEAGYKVDDEVIDEPVTIGGWSPRNSSGRFAGAMSVRTAFAYSVNTIAAKLCSEIGFSKSEEHTSELQSLMRISYAVFCLKKNNIKKEDYRDQTFHSYEHIHYTLVLHTT